MSSKNSTDILIADPLQNYKPKGKSSGEILSMILSKPPISDPKNAFTA